MDKWEHQYRESLNASLTDGSYAIGEGKFKAVTGKSGYIDYLVEIRKFDYAVFKGPELQRLPSWGIKEYPEIFLITGVPVPEIVKPEVPVNQGLLAQIRQSEATYEPLTQQKMIDIINDLTFKSSDVLSATENKKKL